MEEALVFAGQALDELLPHRGGAGRGADRELLGRLYAVERYGPGTSVTDVTGHMGLLPGHERHLWPSVSLLPVCPV